MKKILLNGCNGKMGRVISQCIKDNYDDCVVVGGIDLNTTQNFDYPVFSNVDEIDVDVHADVIIDFSLPAALDSILSYAVDKKIPIVIATTGLSQEQSEHINSASETIPVFHTANMSLGVNLISQLAQKAAAVLGNKFDIEIIEMHHNQKIDSPSGTALMLADSINEIKNNKMRYEFDRHSKRSKRTENEIGIHSVRGGTIVGEHEIVFAGNDEVIKISHSASSKQIFATGSINAARFLVGRSAGMYTMKDLIS